MWMKNRVKFLLDSWQKDNSMGQPNLNTETIELARFEAPDNGRIEGLMEAGMIKDGQDGIDDDDDDDGISVTSNIVPTSAGFHANTHTSTGTMASGISSHVQGKKKSLISLGLP